MTVFTSCASSVFLSSYRNTIFNQSAFIFLGLFCTVNVLFAQKPPGIVSTPRRVIGDSKGKAKERGGEKISEANCEQNLEFSEGYDKGVGVGRVCSKTLLAKGVINIFWNDIPVIS